MQFLQVKYCFFYLLLIHIVETKVIAMNVISRPMAALVNKKARLEPSKFKEVAKYACVFIS